MFFCFKRQLIVNFNVGLQRVHMNAYRRYGCVTVISKFLLLCYLTMMIQSPLNSDCTDGTDEDSEYCGRELIFVID